jgi:hypothetical protein
MVKKSLKESLVRRGDKEQINPTDFAKKLRDISEAKDTFFTGTQKKELDGLINLMDHSDRFGKAGQTSNTLTDVILRYGPVGGAIAGGTKDPVKVITGVALMAFANKVLTTKAGRNFLLASSKIEPGSPRMQKLLERLRDHRAMTSATLGGRVTKEKKED